MVLLNKLGSLRLLALVGFLAVLGVVESRAQAFAEGFETVPVAGWFTQNNSVPTGSSTWFQGNTAVFPSQAGPATSYIGANFNATTGTNTISNWLVTPQRLLKAGDVIKFWTRCPTGSIYPDRMQVRMSLAGASTNVGSGNMAVGDFTVLLQDINSAYGSDYPEVWTEFTITLTAAQVAAPTMGRFAFRYFVEMGGPSGDNSNYIGIDTFSFTPGVVSTATDAPVDFNGDFRTDWVVTRNTGGGSGGAITWFWNINNAATPTAASRWGISTDEFFSEDFDGDDKDDIACWRGGAPGTAAFYILNSATSTARVEAFGQSGDDPSVVDDYNNDNRADLAVYRSGAAAGQQSTWYIRTTAGGPVNYVPWGQNGDFPVPGDFDGNGSADFCVQRNDGGGRGIFWTRLSTGTIQPAVTFGLSTDTVVPGDWDGDGKSDLATVRGAGGNIHWYWLSSQNGSINYISPFGNSATDFVAQGDYNGDGRTDAAVWRNGAFWVRDTAGGAITNFALGASGDYPVANFNSH